MELENLITFFNDSGIHTFYPLEFPIGNDPGSTYILTGGTITRGGVDKSYLRVITREVHPAAAIRKANEIKKYLSDNLKGAFFNGLQVLNIESDTPQPLYIGEENGLYSVSYNYTILEG